MGAGERIVALQANHGAYGPALLHTRKFAPAEECVALDGRGPHRARVLLRRTHNFHCAVLHSACMCAVAEEQREGAVLGGG